MNELPQMQNYSYSSSGVDWGGLQQGRGLQQQAWAGFGSQGLAQYQQKLEQAFPGQLLPSAQTTVMQPKEEKRKMTAPKRRLVKVIIADPDDSVPVKDALLYVGDEQFTDLTNEELFFDLDIKSLLATHNEKRTKLKRKGKEKAEYLEAARIRDLKMTVVEIATF